MKKSNLYLLVLVFMLGTAQYVHMKFSARMDMYEEQRSISLKKINKIQLLERFENDKIEFKKNDQIRITDTVNQKIVFMSIAEDVTAEEPDLKFYQKKIVLKGSEGININDISLFHLMRKVPHEKTIQLISKKDLKQSIENSDFTLALLNLLMIEKEEPLGDKLMISPFVGFLLLLGFFLSIWLLDFVSSFLGGLLNQPQWRILCVLIFIPFFISFIKADIRTYQALIGTGEKWSSLFTLRIIVDLMLIPFVLLFFYFKNNFFDKLEFADGEAAKFGWLFLGVLGYKFAYGYVDALLFYDLEPNTEFTRIWNTVQNPATALLVASGNFLNNFRKHFFQLKNKEQALEISKIKELESSSELEALQAKVNPHFLYNSLNSIASLAKEDPVKTEAMAMALSKFYKYSTNRQDELWATVESEIEMLTVYLGIEKIRFGERLQVHFKIDETTKDIKLPRFLLQPLVENAIKYGYDENSNKINVQIFSEKKENQLHLKIMDSGIDFSEEMNSGYGLRSVQKKLKLLYPDKHELVFINQPMKSVFLTIDL